MSLPQGIVINADVDFAVIGNGQKLGELHLSKGSIDWRPAHSKKTEYRLSWEKFADLMTANGRCVKL